MGWKPPKSSRFVDELCRYDVLMSNPAAMLHEFFSLSEIDQRGIAVTPLLLATVDLEKRLDALQLAGANIRPFAGLVGSIRTEIKDHSDGKLGKITNSNRPKCSLTDPEISLLELASERIDLTPIFTEDNSKKIESLLSALQDIVVSDNSLDPELRLFISQSIIAIRGEMATYTITGDFNLREAILRLFGLISAAQATSDEPKKWQDAWEKWGMPIAQGLIVSVPQIALSAAQVFKAVTG